MESQDLLFLEQHQHNFETVKLGFVNNLHPSILSGYEAIFKKYLDPSFVLTPWCSSCVMSMLTHLINLYEQNKVEPLPINEINETENVPKKRTRTKKQ